MINYLCSRIYRPENGWDPVSGQNAARYSVYEWNSVNDELINKLDSWVGGLSGKQVLDLGGGAGQYSVAFAKRGANVTWYDVSNNYRKIAQKKAAKYGVTIRFAIGYLDEACRHLPQHYDLVFNRICWYYGFNDYSFSEVIYALVRPGGVGYVDTTHSGYKRKQLTVSSRLRTWLNDHLAIKIGHPYPPHGRLAKLFVQKPVKYLFVDYSSPENDRLLFVK
jgi:2-polyprenyl-3-methyl-5-hydroxy-6-metoxy-1,4-benzoquinol methylase